MLKIIINDATTETDIAVFKFKVKILIQLKTIKLIVSAYYLHKPIVYKVIKDQKKADYFHNLLLILETQYLIKGFALSVVPVYKIVGSLRWVYLFLLISTKHPS